MTKRKPTAPAKVGRPGTPNKAELIEAVCRRIAEGELVRDAARAEGIEPSTIWRWTREDAAFGNLYAQAKTAAADALAEEAIECARNAMGLPSEGVQAARLRVDTLKWAAAKRRPKEFGDKVDLTSDGKELRQSQVIVIGDRTIEF